MQREEQGERRFATQLILVVRLLTVTPNDMDKAAGKRWIMLCAAVIFGIVPATFLVLWVAVLLIAAAWPFEALEVDVTIVWWRVGLFLLTAAAAIVGCVALIRAVRGSRTFWTVIGLSVGIAANLRGIQMAWDLNSYAMKHWSVWYWFVAPILVALVYIASYLLHKKTSKQVNGARVTSHGSRFIC